MCIPGLGYVLSWTVTLHWSVYIPRLAFLVSLYVKRQCFVCVPGLGYVLPWMVTLQWSVFQALACVVSLCVLTSTFCVYSRTGMCLSWTVTLQWSVCIPGLVYVYFVLNSNIYYNGLCALQELASLGLDRLKSALMALGLKCGGYVLCDPTPVWLPLCDPIPVWPHSCCTPLYIGRPLYPYDLGTFCKPKFSAFENMKIWRERNRWWGWWRGQRKGDKRKMLNLFI